MTNPITEALKKPANRVPTREVTNLSPSAILCFEKTPVEFFFRYMYDGPKPPFTQTRPMAFGSAFDGRVKELLAQRDPKNFDPKRFGLLKFVDKAFHGDLELKRVCEMLAQAYVEGPPGAHLKKFRPVIMEGSPSMVEIGGGMMYGKVDVQTSEPRILDFKVSGSNSKAYPVVGYVDGWLYDMNPRVRVRWEHTEGHPSGFRSLVETKEDWAFQLVIYDMLRHGGPGLKFKSNIGVDQVSFRKPGLIHFTHLREAIPCAYKKKVVERVARVWKAIRSGTVLAPELRNLPVGQLDLLRGQIRKF